MTLSYERDCLVIEVNDTGRGYAGEHDGTGSGIIGMRERAATLGGVLEAGPRLEGGFRVRACLPVKSAPVGSAA